MSDLRAYIEERKARDPEFAKDYDTSYAEFKIGVILKRIRERSRIETDTHIPRFVTAYPIRRPVR